MPNICRPMQKLEEKNVVKFKVPSGATLAAGDVIMCETLDTTRTDNIEVYLGAQLTDITAEFPCIIINQGFETLSDGRRPAGDPNPANFTFTEGDTVTAIRLEHDLRFFISSAALDNTGVVAPAVDVKLIPQNSDYQLATAAAFGTAVAGLNVEKLYNFATGGQFGSVFVAGVIARVILGR